MFSDYVRLLAASGESAQPRQVALVWAELRRALRTELKRRGLWLSSPSYLGIYGFRQWDETPARARVNAPLETRGRDDALEELTAGCYSFIFVDRLRSLMAQLLVKSDIEGLVTLDLRHYLYELQKRYDPLGFRVFALARSAVRRSLELGELHVLAGDVGVRNDTLLGFGTAPDLAPAAGAELRGPVSRWNDELLPDLVTAHGKAKAEVAERLGRRIMSLRLEGVERFRFKDLVDALKSDVRSRWAELLRDPRLEVELEVDARASFAGVVQCVDEALDRLETDERNRGYLKTVWRFLWLRASEAEAGDLPPATARPPAAAETPAAAEPLAGDRLSQRRVAELLHLPRERLPEIYRTLGRLLTACRDSAGERASQAPAMPPGRPLAAVEKTAAAAREPAGGRRRDSRSGAHHHLGPEVTEDAG
ncbi:MAG TPA: hypothetical protein VHB47_20725 [Thermoanaerobaculia bacterium]|nr:hypothetical protein [Thermoanaerobaculia bacterium]